MVDATHAPSQSPARPALLIYAGLGAVAVLGIGLSLMIGPAAYDPVTVWNSLTAGAGPTVDAVVREIRLPRALLGFCVGAILAASGAALQGYLRNPLAEPSVLGASNAAALGAAIALYFGLWSVHPLALPLMAVAGAVIALGLVITLARGAESALTLILAGIAVSTLCGAAISLALNLSPNPFAALEITFWMLGSLQDRTMAHLALAAPLMAAGFVLIVWDGRALDALSLGEDAATSLGFNLGWVRLRLMAGVALGVGAAVAVSGAIGFVGLIVPHLMRGLVGYQPSRLIGPSALAGGALLCFADVLVRIIPATNELKLGVITAFLGIPFFLLLILRAKRLW